MSRTNQGFKVYLGKIKGENTLVFLTGFRWDCNWYWGGGNIQIRNMHTHFDGCFLDVVDVRGHSLGNFVSPWYKGRFPEGSKEISNGCSVWENLDFFLDDAQFTDDEWWRIKDLYKQFYKLRDAAEVFQYGGQCTSKDRAKEEVNKEMADSINDHIEKVIIPQIKKALKVVD
jgi:hypothetical protein